MFLAELSAELLPCLRFNVATASTSSATNRNFFGFFFALYFIPVELKDMLELSFVKAFGYSGEVIICYFSIIIFRLIRPVLFWILIYNTIQTLKLLFSIFKIEIKKLFSF